MKVSVHVVESGDSRRRVGVTLVVIHILCMMLQTRSVQSVISSILQNVAASSDKTMRLIYY